jgi:hypothetical protein
MLVLFDKILKINLFQNRKAIIKSFKTYSVKICKEEFGHMVMLALFDSVDDTKIVQKIILDVWLHVYCRQTLLLSVIFYFSMPTFKFPPAFVTVHALRNSAWIQYCTCCMLYLGDDEICR